MDIMDEGAHIPNTIHLPTLLGLRLSTLLGRLVNVVGLRLNQHWSDRGSRRPGFHRWPLTGPTHAPLGRCCPEYVGPAHRSVLVLGGCSSIPHRDERSWRRRSAGLDGHSSPCRNCWHPRRSTHLVFLLRRRPGVSMAPTVTVQITIAFVAACVMERPRVSWNDAPGACIPKRGQPIGSRCGYTPRPPRRRCPLDPGPSL
mmetsp:Transcript_50421/g.109902  ORF Transcript_50421/g.109902 Transcript_50421/m.109902 type:complete len:200 (+) Transcript_50421:22-621(+)